LLSYTTTNFLGSGVKGIKKPEYLVFEAGSIFLFNISPEVFWASVWSLVPGLPNHWPIHSGPSVEYPIGTGGEPQPVIPSLKSRL